MYLKIEHKFRTSTMFSFFESRNILQRNSAHPTIWVETKSACFRANVKLSRSWIQCVIGYIRCQKLKAEDAFIACRLNPSDQAEHKFNCPVWPSDIPVRVNYIWICPMWDFKNIHNRKPNVQAQERKPKAWIRFPAAWIISNRQQRLQSSPSVPRPVVYVTTTGKACWVQRNRKEFHVSGSDSNSF